jgi:hypothetical protein
VNSKIVGVGVGVGVSVTVGVGVGVSVGVSVLVGVTDGVPVGVSVLVGVGVSVGVSVLVGVGVGVTDEYTVNQTSIDDDAENAVVALCIIVKLEPLNPVTFSMKLDDVPLNPIVLPY